MIHEYYNADYPALLPLVPKRYTQPTVPLQNEAGWRAFISKQRRWQPVKIVDLADDLIKLSGLQPGKDIPIIITVKSSARN
jgi:hypothetical protein